MENLVVILTYVLTEAYFIRMFYRSTKKLGVRFWQPYGSNGTARDTLVSKPI
jgi:hypothetical protein